MVGVVIGATVSVLGALWVRRWDERSRLSALRRERYQALQSLYADALRVCFDYRVSPAMPDFRARLRDTRARIELVAPHPVIEAFQKYLDKAEQGPHDEAHGQVPPEEYDEDLFFTEAHALVGEMRRHLATMDPGER